MANTYSQAYALATDPTFVQRVVEAVLSTASDITNEVNTTPNHTKRSALATACAASPDQYGAIFSKAICATDLNLTSASLDATIKSDISSVWNTVAGGL